mgnify:CR=1 FL=1
MIKTFLKYQKVRSIRQYVWDSIVNGFINLPLFPLFLRIFFYRCLGLKLHKNASIQSNCYIGSKNIILGKNSYINRRCYIDNGTGAKVIIGENCSIGFNVTFITTSHLYENHKKRGGGIIAKDIAIGDGVWIGANSTILQGVRIENGCVIASGSVVLKDCLPNKIYAGVPAKIIKSLD